MNDDWARNLIWRHGTTSNNKERIKILQKKAESSIEILRKAYKTNPSFLRLEIPRKDLGIQRKQGGTRSDPVFWCRLGLMDSPLLIPTDRTLPESRVLEEFVIPLFTSPSRLNQFWKNLKKNGCMIPEGSIKKTVLFTYTKEIASDLEKGLLVINPLPELVLTAYQIMHFKDEGDLEMILVVVEPEESKKADNLNSFFKKRT